MRVRSVATGEVIDIAEEGATILIDAGLYEPVSDAPQGDPPPVLTKMAKPITSRRRRA
jgi:hypothetical protein